MIAILLPNNSSYSVIAPALPYYCPSMDICVENLANSPLLAAIFALYLKFFDSNLINQTYSEVPWLPDITV